MFCNIAKMKPLAAEGPETPLKKKTKRFFFNTASEIHRKLQGLQLKRSRVGGGSAAGGAAYNHHRRPPARTRAPWSAPGLLQGVTKRCACHAKQQRRQRRPSCGQRRPKLSGDYRESPSAAPASDNKLIKASWHRQLDRDKWMETG